MNLALYAATVLVAMSPVVDQTPWPSTPHPAPMPPPPAPAAGTATVAATARPEVMPPARAAIGSVTTSPPPVRFRFRPPTAAELRVRIANRAATFEPATSGYINAVQIFPYSDGTIYHVLTAPGQVTDIALQPGEALGSVAAGDTVRWIIGDTISGSGDTKRTHILVKPFAAGLATNVVIATDRRTYHLALTSTGQTAMAALSWTYPLDQLIAVRVAVEHARAAEPVAAGLQVDQLRFNYAITGDQPSWRPLRAFDDGRQTFIEFPASLAVGEAPPLFLVDSKGTASLVNYRVQGHYYVVDRLFDTAELRLGLKHQDVVRISRTGEPANSRRSS